VQRHQVQFVYQIQNLPAKAPGEGIIRPAREGIDILFKTVYP